MPYVTLPASSQNLRLYYEIFGSGENKVLFIMGLLTEGAAWCRQVNIYETLVFYLYYLSFRLHFFQKNQHIKYVVTFFRDKSMVYIYSALRTIIVGVVDRHRHYVCIIQRHKWPKTL